MVWKILLWLVISFGIGKALNILLTPVEFIYSILIFATPFIIFGFQEVYYDKLSILSIFRINIYVKREVSKRMTFWGIPISGERIVITKGEIFPEPEELAELITALLRFLPYTLRWLPTKIFRRLYPKRIYV